MKALKLLTDLKDEIVCDFRATKDAYKDIDLEFRRNIADMIVHGDVQDYQNHEDVQYKLKSLAERDLKKICFYYLDKIEKIKKELEYLKSEHTN